MTTKNILMAVGWTFLFAFIITGSLEYPTLKRAGLWQPVKAFGITVGNWSLHKSHILFWRRRNKVDPKTKKTMYILWGLEIFFFVSALGFFLLSSFWP